MKATCESPEALRTRFCPGEWAHLLAWPWVLASAVACAVKGVAGPREGEAAAVVVGAGVVFIALVGAPLAGSALRGLGHAERVRRAGLMALLVAALASPAFVACAVGAPATAGTVVGGARLCGVTMYAFTQATAAARAWYPAVAVLWLGAPPFAYYLLMDIIGVNRRAHDVSWILALGPASAALRALSGPASAWSRLVGAALVPVLVGAALSFLPVEQKDDGEDVG